MTEMDYSAADDLDDVTADEYEAAAEQLAQEAAEAQHGTTEARGEEGDDSPRDRRYRQRAQDAEAERDRLAAIVEGMRRAEIERLAADRLADPADLFAGGATLADLLDEAGHVDPARLDGVVEQVLGDHPHWRKPLAPYRGPMFSGATNTRALDKPGNGFVDAFAPSDSTD